MQWPSETHETVLFVRKLENIQNLFATNENAVKMATLGDA